MSGEEPQPMRSHASDGEGMAGRCARVGWIGVAVCAVALLVAIARPEPVDAEQRCSRSSARQADRHKQRGFKMIADDPAGAAAELEKANEICPDPWYLGVLAIAYEKQGRIRDAIKAIDDYLATPDVPQREQAVAARERLRSLQGQVEIRSEPPGATVVIDEGERTPPLFTPATVDLPPGEHRVALSLPGYQRAERVVTVVGGEDVVVDVTLEAEGVEPEPGPGPEPEPEPEPEPVPRPGPRLRWTGAVQVSLGALVPVMGDALVTGLGVGGDLGGGLEIGLVRIELIALLYASPSSHGYLLEAGGGPRVAVRIGTLPLTVEADMVVGLCYVVVDRDGLVIPKGEHASLTFIPSIGLAWGPLAWLEVVARPLRLELLGLAGDLPGGFAMRYGLDAGLRFRL